VADGYAVFADDFKYTITAADGSQWTSPWEGMLDHTLPGENTGRVSMRIKPALYERVKSGPVTLHITLAVSRYQADTVTQMKFPAKDAAIAGLGYCSPQFREEPNLHCRSALRRPRLIYATTLWTKGACTDAPQPLHSTMPGAAWTEPVDLDFALASVWSTNYFFFPRGPDEDLFNANHWHICPGSPLTLTQYHLVDRTQTSLTLENYMLPALANPAS
jgi:hypothetical protein